MREQLLKPSFACNVFCIAQAHLKDVIFISEGTVSIPEEGWRTENELFVSTLGLSSWHLQWRWATHRGFNFRSYEYIADCFHGNKNNHKDSHVFAISHLFASFFQSYENDFAQYYHLKKMKNLFRGFLKILQFPFLIKKKKEIIRYIFFNYYVKKASISWSIQTFTKFYGRKHEKSERVFSSFACLWPQRISRRPREHAYQRPLASAVACSKIFLLEFTSNYCHSFLWSPNAWATKQLKVAWIAFWISFVLCNTIWKTLYQVIYYLSWQDGAVRKFYTMA